jgi:hypothetical protein
MRLDKRTENDLPSGTSKTARLNISSGGRKKAAGKLGDNPR